MKKILFPGCMWLLLPLIYSPGLHAYLADPGTCSLSSMTITRIENTPLDGNDIVFDGSINATQCFGVNTAGAPAANDDAGGRSEPSPNLGWLGDGFLNGERLLSGPDSALNPYLFIDSPGNDDSPSLSQPHDRFGDGSVFDPGWIHLANINANGTTKYSTLGTGADALNLADLLSIFWDCANGCGSGTWSIETAPDIVDKVQGLLGPNTFDHLAISVFQANKLAVYDFDFTILTQPTRPLEGAIDFLTAYAFSGTWSMADFHPQSGAFSHVNFWARDPVGSTTNVPEPAPLLLMAAGLLGLTLLRVRGRRRC